MGTLPELEKVLNRNQFHAAIIDFSGLEHITGGALQNVLRLAGNYNLVGAALPQKFIPDYELLQGQGRMPLYEDPERAKKEFQNYASVRQVLSQYVG